MRTSSYWKVLGRVLAPAVTMAGVAAWAAAGPGDPGATPKDESSPTVALNVTPDNARKCGAREPTELEMLAVQTTLLRNALAPANGGTIPVHVHVINNGGGVANGDLPPSPITDQIAVLNAAYPTGGWGFPLAPGGRPTEGTCEPVQPGQAPAA